MVGHVLFKTSNVNAQLMRAGRALHSSERVARDAWSCPGQDEAVAADQSMEPDENARASQLERSLSSQSCSQDRFITGTGRCLPPMRLLRRKGWRSRDCRGLGVALLEGMWYGSGSVAGPVAPTTKAPGVLRHLLFTLD